MYTKSRKTVFVVLCIFLCVCVGCDDKKNESLKKDFNKYEHDGLYGTENCISAFDVEKTNYLLQIDASDEIHEISDLLYGVFFEDINFAADGGLYAEMVQNRSFEFGRFASGKNMHGWNADAGVSALVVTGDKEGYLNENNESYLRIINRTEKPLGVSNIGFLDGMFFEEGKTYLFSVYARGIDGYEGKIHISLSSKNEILDEEIIPEISSEWERYELKLSSPKSVSSGARLNVRIDEGAVAFDMISLFPEDTFNNRENGLRKDLAEAVAELNPAFIRFPGGCIIEGVSLDTAYDWKDSIGVGKDGEPLLFNGKYGDVAARRLGQNLWTDENTTTDQYPCYMTYGLGFYEYFLFAEDIGAIGVPVLNCGICCMGQSDGAEAYIGTERFEGYVQDALDLVEFCRGDEKTKWGAVRISMGHKDPFALKYIAIGNEQWGPSYYAHYKEFVNAFEEAAKKNPKLFDGIELVFSSGIDDGDSGTHYMKSYEYTKQWLIDNPDKTISDFAGATDHHYYNSPDWFLRHTDYYDEENYSRDIEKMTDTRFGGGLKVFLGEYAAQSNTWRAAMAEAAYMTGLERNGDVVIMSAYAPLFGQLTRTHWSPDLIWFNNHTVTKSVNYAVQKLFSDNAGLKLLKSELTGEIDSSEIFGGRVGVGTWNTAAVFDDIMVKDNKTEKVMASCDFSMDEASKSTELHDNWYMVSDGKFEIVEGALVQSSLKTDTNRYANTGSAAYYGDERWTDYTYTLTAKKTAGSEGFLIPFAVKDNNNSLFWNIGGWGNTVSCLQQVSNGSKSDQLYGTAKKFKVQTGKEYKLKIVVGLTTVKCYIDDVLYVDYDLDANRMQETYQVVSTDATGDVIIKLVNVTDEAKTYAINVDGLYFNKDVINALEVDKLNVVETDVNKSDISEKKAKVCMNIYQAGGGLPSDDNILGQKEKVYIREYNVCVDRDEGTACCLNRFNYTVPRYSVTVIRIKNMK